MYCAGGIGFVFFSSIIRHTRCALVTGVQTCALPIYGEMIVRDFSLSDPRGRFLTSPELRIDWRPFAFLSNHVDVRSASAERVNVLRLPEFKPVPDTGEPLLPDIDIDVATLRVDRNVFAYAAAGESKDARHSGKNGIAARHG